VAQSREDAYFVLLKLHTCAATMAEAPTRKRVLDIGGYNLYSSREALNDSNERRAVRLT
jgi:hypothetical protein